MISLRKLATVDLPAVSALGIRSKASWGYTEEEMRVFSKELALTESDLASLADAQVAHDGEQVVGYFTLRKRADGVTELEHLFVDPAHFGRRIGTRLLAAALASAGKDGVTELELIADPNSSGFYLKHAAEIVGEHDSGIAGRKIPIMRIALRPGV